MTNNNNPNQPRGHENNSGGFSAYLNSLPEHAVALVPVNPEQQASLDAILEDVYDIANRTETRGGLLVVDFWEPDEDGEKTEFVTRVILRSDGSVDRVLLAVTDKPEDLLHEQWGDWLDVYDDHRGHNIRDAVSTRISPLPRDANAEGYGMHIEQMQNRGKLPTTVDPHVAGAYVEHWLREHPTDTWKDGDKAELIEKAAEAYEGNFESDADFARHVAVRYDNADLSTDMSKHVDWNDYAADLLKGGFFEADALYFRDI
jgi:hypothetical protein